MSNKFYSSRLKQKYDAIGKSLAKEIMRDLVGAKFISDNIKEDNGDFTDGFWDQKYTLPNGKEIKVEPEMKDEKWWGNQFSTERPFKYEEMDIPYRKAKNQSHVHIVISTCKKFAFVVTRQDMDKSVEESGGKPKTKKTIYEPEGGEYFSIPVSKGKFLQKGPDGKWRKWQFPTFK